MRYPQLRTKGWPSNSSPRRVFIALLMALFVFGGDAQAQTQKPKPKLAELSLEELMDIKVTSVSKKEELLFKSPAAVFVISQEDIHRSGLTSIPELLRMVPGLEVARMNSNQWAISTRGFNGRFANKMLVLIDGRSVYNVSFSGVFWDMQDTLLEDIERIEVIRGPGASLWGANAVNGVINILTKRAEKTQGVLATLGGGSEERGFAGVRYGGELGSKAAYRIYAKSFVRDQSVDATGRGAGDDWEALQGGFRMDWDPTGRDSLTWQGDLYTGEEGQTSLSGVPIFSSDTTSSRNDFSGGNLLARWKRVFSDRSDLSLQMYYDRYSREIGDVQESRDSFDLDFQHQLRIGRRHEIVWGAGYRYMTDNIHFVGSTTSPFSPASRSLNLFSAFVQDEINLVQDRVRLTLGSKFEHNDYTGFEVEPSVRLLWTPRGRHAFWAAVSRAVRTPSRQDSESFSQGSSAFVQDGGPLFEILTLTRTGIRSEVLVAGEIGYRLQANDRLSMDLTAFYGAYSNLKTYESTAPVFVEIPEPPHWVVRQYTDYDMLGHTYGVEMAADWRITEAWKLSLGYTHFGIRGIPLQTDMSSGVISIGGTTSGNDPRHQLNLRSHLTLPHNLECDVSLYYVDHLEAGSIPSYIRLDGRFGWRLTKNLDVSVVLQNLLQPRHAEYKDMMGSQSSIQVQRGAYGKVTWRF